LENLNDSQELAFDVALHSGTLLAVIFFFRDKIIWGLKKIFRDFSSSGRYKSQETKFIFLIAIATLPGALAGYFLDEIINIFRNPQIVATTLLFYGILLLAADRYCQYQKRTAKKEKKELNFKNLSLSKALIIGIFQALALVPGTSRSGITITGGLFLGFSRKRAAIFSFILSIPIIAGATLVKLPFFLKGEIDFLLLILGVLTSFAVGFFAIKYMLKYLTSKSYLIFVIYRIGLAAIIFWLIGKNV